MDRITFEDWQKILKEHEYAEENATKTCPNGIIKEKGKPTVVWAHYNDKRYTWILEG